MTARHPFPQTEAEYTAMVAACPEPFWHETHRYCPVCPWREGDWSTYQTWPEIDRRVKDRRDHGITLPPPEDG